MYATLTPISQIYWVLDSFPPKILFNVLMCHYNWAHILVIPGCSQIFCFSPLSKLWQSCTSLHHWKFIIIKSPALVQINVAVITCVTFGWSLKGHCAICHIPLSLQKEIKRMCQGGTWLNLGQGRLPVGGAKWARMKSLLGFQPLGSESYLLWCHNLFHAEWYTELCNKKLKSIRQFIKFLWWIKAPDTNFHGTV